MVLRCVVLCFVLCCVVMFVCRLNLSLCLGLSLWSLSLSFSIIFSISPSLFFPFNLFSSPRHSYPQFFSCCFLLFLLLCLSFKLFLPVRTPQLPCSRPVICLADTLLMLHFLPSFALYALPLPAVSVAAATVHVAIAAVTLAAIPLLRRRTHQRAGNGTVFFLSDTEAQCQVSRAFAAT